MRKSNKVSNACFSGVKFFTGTQIQKINQLIKNLPTIFEQNQSFLPRVQIKGLFPNLKNDFG